MIGIINSGILQNPLIDLSFCFFKFEVSNIREFHLQEKMVDRPDHHHHHHHRRRSSINSHKILPSPDFNTGGERAYNSLQSTISLMEVVSRVYELIKVHTFFFLQNPILITFQQ